jgi:PKD repeat protein
MTKIWKNIIMVSVGAFLLACEPMEVEKPNIGDPLSEDQVSFTINPKSENPNVVVLTNTTPKSIAVWDFGNGITSKGEQVTASYPLQGEYTVTLTVYTRGGSTSVQKKVVIANTNYAMLDVPEYNILTGGADALEGKTWVIDKSTPGHMGVGPADGTTPEWWSAPPNDKEGGGLYDDEFTFMLNQFKFIQKVNGDVFVNGAHVDAFPGAVPVAGDWKAPYTPPANMAWSISEEDGKMFLNLSNGGFIGYYTGVSKYQILKLEENEIFIKFLDSKNAALAWYHRLIPKGFERPVEPMPIRAANLKDDFDTPGNFAWYTNEVAGFTRSYDNPAPVGINTSSKVAKYVRGAGEGNMWNNLQIRLDHKMDLTQKNKFTLMVYMPSYNDYETESAPDWWPVYRKLTPIVSVKLQNGELGEPWNSQAEIVKPVSEFNKWVKLEFDFSAQVERQDFDRVIVQIGGEGHYIPGIFFIDNFELLEN